METSEAPTYPRTFQEKKSEPTKKRVLDQFIGNYDMRKYSRKNL